MPNRSLANRSRSAFLPMRESSGKSLKASQTTKATSIWTRIATSPRPSNLRPYISITRKPDFLSFDGDEHSLKPNGDLRGDHLHMRGTHISDMPIGVPCPP